MKITLNSGKELHITLATFAVSRNLLQAMLAEAKDLKFDPDAQVDVNVFKDLFCVGLSSKKIEAALHECLKKAVYDGQKCDSSDTWEKEDARGDYLEVCFEVAKANISPFTKTLTAQFKQVLTKAKSVLK
jgi:hypothetical protein